MDANRKDATVYIADQLRELADIARAVKLDTLAYLLEMARLEAEQVVSSLARAG